MFPPLLTRPHLRECVRSRLPIFACVFAYGREPIRVFVSPLPSVCTHSVTYLPYASRDPLVSLLRTTPSPALSREPSRTVAPCARLAACLRALRLDAFL